MAGHLIDSLATTPELAAVFSDESVLRAMLDFEVALARAEAKLGIVPEAAATAIAQAAKTVNFDTAALAQSALRAGTASIPLVKALTAQVRAADSDAARFVHWGATSQDVSDTALILLLKKAQGIIAADLRRLEKALRRLSDQHRDSLMLGRTLMQPAPPVTFGLKAAGWRGAICRSRMRLDAAFREGLLLQFGGAAGTLAALDQQGLKVGESIAEELGLGFPDAPWHAHRDRLAAMVVSCGVLTGSLGKMARDVSLLMQSEVAEAMETGDEGRGGSSTMPHKHNPIGSTLTLAAANRVPGLVATFLFSMVQEHERAAGGWQSEWPTVSGIVQSLGLASSSMAEVAQSLRVDPSRMRENIAATRGAPFSERAAMLLGRTLGRDVAHRVLAEAAQRSDKEGRHLAEVLADMKEDSAAVAPGTWNDLEDPAHYQGVAEQFRKRLLGGSCETTDPED